MSLSRMGNKHSWSVSTGHKTIKIFDSGNRVLHQVNRDRAHGCHFGIKGSKLCVEKQHFSFRCTTNIDFG